MSLPPTPYLVAALTGNNGKVGKSDDGVTWTESAQILAGLDLYYVKGMDSTYWLLSGYISGVGKVYKSTDGLTWTLITTGLVSNCYVFGAMIKFNGLYCLGAVANTTTSSLYRKSADLITWSDPVTANAGFGAASGVAIDEAATDGSILVLVGSSQTPVAGSHFATWSSDGSTFTSCSLPGGASGNLATLRGITYSAGLGVWVAVGTPQSGGKNIIRSTDGKTWAVHSGSIPTGWANNSATCVVWVASLGLFVAVGSPNLIATSPDGNTWTARTGVHGSDAIRRVVWAPALSLLVAVGDNGAKVSTSPDGITWTLRSPGWTGGASIGYGIGVSSLPNRVFPVAEVRGNDNVTVIAAGSTTVAGQTAFPNTPVFQSNTLTFRLHNTGTDPLTVSGIALSGANAGQFALDSAHAGAVVPAAGTLVFTVTMTPTAVNAALKCTCTVSSDSGSNPSYAFDVGGATTAPEILSLFNGRPR